MSAYDELTRRFRRMAALRGAAGMLHWDRAVVMPAGGAESRAEQLAAIEVILHEMITAPDIPDLIEAAEEEAADETWRAANLREIRRRHAHAAAVETDLLEASSKANSRCEMAWREARAKSDYKAILPLLGEVLTLVRRIAEAKSAALGVPPYQALMDQYEPGLTTARVDALFDELGAFLPGTIDNILERQAARAPALPLGGPFPTATQEALGRRFMQALGFDFERGRLDVSLHPFCGGGPDDIRITTRYDEDDFAESLMGVLHETGHALYELGLPEEWRLQPVGRSRGMAVHESQSLIMEMQACRSREFLEFAAPMIREAFGVDGPEWAPDNLHRHYTKVERGLIRVDADEVTYPAHVILRYRLERALIAGDLALADLPGAWNDSMRELVGVVPPDDAQGCLQDIHWYDGAYGYFPTYALGALLAAQLFAAARTADPTVPEAIAKGDFAPLLRWLRQHVHTKASLLPTDELVEAATGTPLGTDAYRRHIETRYLA